MLRSKRFINTFMGNVSNPCITRWGMNTFWYRFWYSDTNYALNVNQDRNFIKLINLYIYYGLSVPRNFFYSPYWYKKELKTLNSPNYYRHLTIKNRALSFNSTYRLRNRTIDVYPMKIWVLKYDHWVIINFYWFQPNKKKRTHRKRMGRPFEAVHLGQQAPQINNNFRKLKTVLSLNLIRLFLNRKYYAF